MTVIQAREAKRRRKASDLAGLLLILVLVPVLIPVGLCYVVYGAVLRLTAWTFYCTRGVNVLFVYSNSPIWKDHLERNIIPHLPDSSLMLNWSERSGWNRASLPVLLFRHFGGSAAFNPLALVFRPFRRTRVFRFWQPFLDFKHGDTQALQGLESEFLKELKGVSGP